VFESGKIVARLDLHRATMVLEVCCHVGLMKKSCHDYPVTWHDWICFKT